MGVGLRRGDIYWADLRDPIGSEPGYRRPVLIISADTFNDSGLRTVIAAAITSNTDLLDMPGTVALPANGSGLERDSVINLTQLTTLDKVQVTDWTGATLTGEAMRRADEGLANVLQLAR